jgi:tRNA(Ile2)-agmatinylcytidine synthase
VTVVGIDDTDSRDRGMCTTYLAHRLVRELGAAGEVGRPHLVRLNPAVEHKTRGNAALAVATGVAPATAFTLARELVAELAETDDPNTDPGVVVAPGEEWAGDALDAVVAFARSAVRDRLTVADAERLLALTGYDHAAPGSGPGRGRIGALAAVGALAARHAGGDGDDGADTEGPAATFADWTYECIAYREQHRWGTPREVDVDSVFAADAEHDPPAVFDTVDRVEREAVCVPRTPGPVLHGIRGEDPGACEAVSRAIEGEPPASRQTFVTNQGTDAHLRDGTVEGVAEGRAYRVPGRVVSTPETRQGGHVFLEIAPPDGESESERTLSCVAFEPTKRFRDRVRALRPGDRLLACGEVGDGPTLKLEKFAVRELSRTERVVPDCPDCGRRMESAGRDQGYRCRDCGTGTGDKVEVPVERELAVGWYEVPPTARRHIARPLCRGGFDAPTHPE